MTNNRRDHAAYVASFVLGRNVLDIGCGDGTLLSLIGRGVGVDYSKVAVERTQELGFPCFHADAADLPFEDRSWQYITCIEVLEHARHPERIASEIMRVLGDGGMLVVGVPDGAKDTWDGHLNRFSVEDIENLFSELKMQEWHMLRSDLVVVMRRKPW